MKCKNGKRIKIDNKLEFLEGSCYLIIISRISGDTAYTDSFTVRIKKDADDILKHEANFVIDNEFECHIENNSDVVEQNENLISYGKWVAFTQDEIYVLDLDQDRNYIYQIFWREIMKDGSIPQGNAIHTYKGRYTWNWDNEINGKLGLYGCFLTNTKEFFEWDVHCIDQGVLECWTDGLITPRHLYFFELDVSGTKIVNFEERALDYYLEIMGDSSKQEYLASSEKETLSSESQNQELTLEQMARKIEKHYIQLWQPDGTYVCFDEEVMVSESAYEFPIRYRRSEAELQEICANGGFPAENVLIGLVSVDRNTGRVSDDMNMTESWSIYE